MTIFKYFIKCAVLVVAVLSLMATNIASATQSQSSASNHNQRENMTNPSQKLIESFYAAFNAKEYDKMYAMVSDNVSHEMNDSGMEKGKKAFIQMLEESVKHYNESVENVIYMVSEDGNHVATRFTFKGEYIATDESKIPAKGQPYSASAINYFDIENGKIVTAICWYNHKDWVKQVSKAK